MKQILYCIRNLSHKKNIDRVLFKNLMRENIEKFSLLQFLETLKRKN